MTHGLGVLEYGGVMNDNIYITRHERHKRDMKNIYGYAATFVHPTLRGGKALISLLEVDPIIELWLQHLQNFRHVSANPRRVHLHHAEECMGR